MLEVKNLVKIYSTKKGVDVHALDGVSVKFPETGMVFLLGKSGSGKSTLLNVSGGLDKPTAGEIIVNGKSSKDFSTADFDSYRNTYVGFIFQEYNILEEFTIAENIGIALQLQNKPNDKKAIEDLLKQVDLEGMGKRKPNTLSGGQRQRVAIARALIKNPKIIMADEPSGALDATTGKQIFDTLKKLSEDRLVIIVSHDNEFARQYADRIIELVDGKVYSDTLVQAEETIEENVCIINDNTITVKDWSKVSEKEVSEIVSVMKKRNKQTVITSDPSKIEGVKNLLGIKEEKEKIAVKTEKREKKAESAEFIKSRLPLRHAIKMAWNVMKTKPIRLAFTILLSVISFTLFGIFSSLMLYDPNYSIADALNHSNYNSVSIEKNYEAYFISTNKNSEGSYEQTQINTKLRTVFTAEEVERLNQNEVGLKFAGILDLGKYKTKLDIVSGYESSTFRFNDDIRIPNEYSRYYSTDLLYGFSDCGSQFMLDNGFTLLAGRYPETTTEIALPEYVYNYYANSLTTTYPSRPLGINEPIDMLGREIKIGEYTFTVTGIYDVGEIPEKYDELLNKDSKLDKYAKEALMSELQDLIGYSFHTIGYVTEDFYFEHKYEKIEIQNRQLKGVSIQEEEHTDGVSDLDAEFVYTPKSVWQNTEMVSFYDVEGQKTSGFNLKKNQVLLSGVHILSLLTELKTEISNKGLSDNPVCAEYLALYNKYNGWSNNGKTNAEYERLIKLAFETHEIVYGTKLTLPEFYYAKNSKGETLTLEVVGFYLFSKGIFSSTARFYLSDEFCDEYALAEEIDENNTSNRQYEYVTDYQVDWKNERYGYLVTKTENRMEQSYFVLESAENGAIYTMTNLVYKATDGVASMVNELKTVFLIVTIVMGVFAMLMLFNFISVSIQAKAKEIGILRAVGARRIDVFKIFITEALFITLLCFTLSTIFSSIACRVINLYTLTTAVKISLFNYGLINVLMSLAMALVVSSISTGLPVIKTSRKSPVESIRAL